MDRGDLDRLHRKVKICRPSSPISWAPSPSRVFKLNFDGVEKGNLGASKYGWVCRKSVGEILKFFYGSIEFDTNNLVELEILVQGFKIIFREGWIPMIIEGDSKILIQMAK